MPVRTRIQPIDDWLSVTVDETLSEEARSSAIADFARGRLREALEANRRAVGSDTPYEQFVDAVKGAPLETVDPDKGVIIFEFELVGDVLTWILQTLRERSPVLSGEYRENHRLFADGREIGAGDEIPDAEEYSFTNPVPYARKIEIGKTKAGRDFVIHVEPRIYERTAKDAQARFGNIAKVGFTYRALVGGAQVNQQRAASSGQPWWLGGGVARAASGMNETRIAKRFGKTAHNRSKLRFPTITVKPT